MFGSVIRTAFVLMGLTACEHRIVPIAQRDAGYTKGDNTRPLYVNSRDDKGPVRPPELFVKQPSIVIKPVDDDSNGGSLFQLDNDRNFLFNARDPFSVGRYITVDVASSHSVNPGSQKGGKNASSGKGPAGAKEGKEGESDAAADAILKSLPNLEPAQAEKLPLKHFKMRIAHRYNNGDVLAELKRSSQAGDQDNEIVAHARIPLERLNASDHITTDDLTDVDWQEVSEGQLVSRDSTGWEDEYSLRLAGFNESKSKAAADLEEKRKRLVEAKEQMETKLKSLSDERQQMATERDELLNAKKKNTEKIQELQKTIKDQKSELDKLDPDDEKDPPVMRKDQ